MSRVDQIEGMASTVGRGILVGTGGNEKGSSFPVLES
jgi:hypothetical protein